MQTSDKKDRKCKHKVIWNANKFFLNCWEGEKNGQHAQKKPVQKSDGMWEELWVSAGSIPDTLPLKKKTAKFFWVSKIIPGNGGFGCCSPKKLQTHRGLLQPAGTKWMFGFAQGEGAGGSPPPPLGGMGPGGSRGLLPRRFAWSAKTLKRHMEATTQKANQTRVPNNSRAFPGRHRPQTHKRCTGILCRDSF